MKLIIGGFAQGKLDYVLAKYHLQENMVWDGVLPDNTALRDKQIIVNHFHQWVKQRILGGGCPEEEILSFLDDYENCIIICDEIGNGIVPIDKFEREYRERVGRILIELAKRAEEVERVLCGIGQKIK
ncbi:MAG: bifunctional adenosylcobinamide kinase/adenosylcobinamide-phosphate guanylyltransferase [Lachnospiraceae bacterium]|nr:bifunctional adenosylcobinamide kinase/adenosylcobinamide-phosphate guanylyltransferase [Lachnospiraceae bacterium]